jgi:hypothetical protein
MRLKLLGSCFVSCGASLADAQTRAVETLPPIFAARPVQAEKASAAASARSTPGPTPAPRAISPERAAKLSAVTSRVASPTSATMSAGAATARPPGDGSAAVELKPYVVREDRIPVFKERDMLTMKGKLDLARRRYAHYGPMPDAALLRKLEEDFAKERREEVVELQGLLGDKLSPALKREIETSMRPSGFSPEFGAPFRPLR